MAWQGWYYDGRTAARRDVTVTLTGDRLFIESAGQPLAVWLVTELRRADSPDATLRLRRGEGDEARLYLPPQAGLEQLLALAPRLTRRLRPGMLAVAAAAALLAFLVVAYLSLPALARPIARLLPDSWIERMGEASATALAGKSLCQGPEGLAALERLVAALSPAGSRPFTIRVSSSPVPNAFTTGGGRIVLLHGLTKITDSPEELAGVLAHEMAHDRLNHVAERMVRQAGIGLITTMLTGDASSAVALAAASLTSLSYGRDDEAAADALGREMLLAAGFGTQGMSRFFQRLDEEHKDKGLPEFLSSHPDNARRAKAAGTVPPTRPAMTPAEWQAVKGMCGKEKT